ncbi:DUF1223 domain-containing protein [Pacificoceanicola onchidii]|uniref:DUF1223 domain-containing protein n=1 Tax=Pacificoceanicola onchidii TaxID=2562685 RepID=UPI0010A46F30|nr:DUF1223 domain-containing protein [Pacificoceanicola onchidii]
MRFSSLKTAALAALFSGLSVLGASAQNSAVDNPVVVELYTSQGCSSCPPADALLADMAGRDDVIPLALHVDYWDYIGWKDSFAIPGFTKRQKGYAQAQGERMIYTPQMVINGREHAVGSRPMKVADLIRKESQRPSPVSIILERNGSDVLITIRSKPGQPPCDIHLVRYMPERKAKILRGENAGHTLTYTHIVNDWQVIGKWKGEGDMEKKIRVSGNEPVVVLLQQERHGPIVAAARLR